VRAQRPRVILPTGELRHLGGLRLGEEFPDPGAGLVEDSGRLFRRLGGLTAWLSFTAFCALLSSKPVGWVPSALATDWEEPLAALRDSALTGPAGVRAASMASPASGARAARRAPAVAPAARPAPVVAGDETGTLDVVAGLTLPPVPKPPNEFGRWLPGGLPKAEVAKGSAGSLAEGSSELAGLTARSPAPCPPGEAGCDGSWGDVEEPAAPANRPLYVPPPSLAPPKVAARAAAPQPTEPEVSAPYQPPPAAAAPMRETRPATAVAGMSCEAAFAAASQAVDFGASGRGARSRSADVPRTAYASLLENERFDQCRMDEAVDIQICVAVKNGHAVGVTVTTRPGNPALSTCVAARVRRLGFPVSAQMDLVRTELTIR
jgi:hypothetical protein